MTESRTELYSKKYFDYLQERGDELKKYCEKHEGFAKSARDYLSGFASKESSQKDDAFKDNYESEYYNDAYLMKYGVVYACEYEQLYELVFSNLGDDAGRKGFGVVSLGCGSEIDLFAMRYALLKVLEEADDHSNMNLSKLHLYYKGIDINKWKNILSSDARFIESKKDPKLTRYAVKSDDADYSMDVADFFPDYYGQEGSYKQSMYLFPKILTELTDETVTKLVEGITNANFDQAKAYGNSIFVGIMHTDARCFDAKNSAAEAAMRIAGAFDEALGKGENPYCQEEPTIPDDSVRYLWKREVCTYSVQGDNEECPYYVINESGLDKKKRRELIDHIIPGIDEKAYQHILVNTLKTLGIYDDQKPVRYMCYADEDKNGRRTAFQLFKYVPMNGSVA